MTEYRTISDGYCDWLQYKAIRLSGWWIFKSLKECWCYIRTDYYDYFDEQWEDWEREYGHDSSLRDYNRYCNSYNTNIEAFINKYPVIEMYLIERARIVKEKRRIAHERHKQISLRAGAIRLFN
jgi:hypothetical protein